jgi:hypothetical protein
MILQLGLVVLPLVLLVTDLGDVRLSASDASGV